MHNAYAVVPVGRPNSDCAVDCPLTHFQISLSFASEALFFRTKSDFAAVLQPVAGVAAFAQPLSGSQESCVHGLSSSQSSGVPCWHAPAPSQASAPLQTLPSDGQGMPAASNWHVEEQQSPSVRLRSSHCSPACSGPTCQFEA